MNSSESNDLSAKLRAWKVTPQVPDSFSREVWQRIAVRQAARDEAYWPSARRWVLAQLERPQYAVAVVFLSLLAGVGFAHVRAQDTNASDWKALEARYAASVDPLSMAH